MSILRAIVTISSLSMPMQGRNTGSGMDKEEIVTIARKIDTFETSILPYEDCCTVFTPKHPNTKPKMPKILEAESHLDVEALVDEAVKGVEIIHLP